MQNALLTLQNVTCMWGLDLRVCSHISLVISCFVAMNHITMVVQQIFRETKRQLCLILLYFTECITCGEGHWIIGALQY